MSNDAGRTATVAKVDDDDEPDEWCVQWMPRRRRENAATDDGALGTRGSSARAAQVNLEVLEFAEAAMLIGSRRKYEVDRLLLREEGLAGVQEGGESGFCFGLEGPHAAAEKMPSSYWACVATTTFHSSSHMLTIGQMEVFRECWKSHNNDQRTATKDV